MKNQGGGIRDRGLPFKCSVQLYPVRSGAKPQLKALLVNLKANPIIVTWYTGEQSLYNVKIVMSIKLSLNASHGHQTISMYMMTTS